jgi:hypothetical protein
MIDIQGIDHIVNQVDDPVMKEFVTLCYNFTVKTADKQVDYLIELLQRIPEISIPETALSRSDLMKVLGMVCKQKAKWYDAKAPQHEDAHRVIIGECTRLLMNDKKWHKALDA